MLLLGLYIAATLIEFALVKSLPARLPRRILVGVVILLDISGSTALLINNWSLWIGLWIFGAYRVINLLRVAAGRMPNAELKRLAPRAFYMLFGLQIASLLLASGTSRLSNSALLIVWAVAQMVVAVFLLRVTLRTWRHTRLPKNISPMSDNELPTVSILIPARNETDDLEACLQTLVANDYPKLEIIVLDDCSVTKRTPEIIRAFAQSGVRFVAGEVPDEVNWLAKNQAYQRLSEQASSEILLFCGVDARFNRQTVRQLVEIMVARNKQMMSVMPLRAPEAQASLSLIQPMRYLWEIVLPRRLFNRPPVLSTCWMITAKSLERFGGFKAVSRKIVPEAYFARQLTATDGYAFVRSNFTLGLTSNKPANDQRDLAIRTRYPQLHRRLELVALTAIAELTLFVGPLVGMATAWLVPYAWFIFGLSAGSYVLLLSMYYHVAVRTKLNARSLAWLIFPVTVITDVLLLHISMWQYEFSVVDWKGRNICIPIMRRTPPKPASEGSE